MKHLATGDVVLADAKDRGETVKRGCGDADETPDLGNWNKNNLPLTSLKCVELISRRYIYNYVHIYTKIYS